MRVSALRVTCRLWEGKPMTPIQIDEYKEEMREAICRVCVSFINDDGKPGRCVHENSGNCALFAHLGEVVDVVSGVQSGSIGPYADVLRQKVCAKCETQDEQGFCRLRDNHDPVPDWCVLDSYFNLVVGAVERVQAAHAASTPARQP